ncbi:MAG: FecCD family ABC transporter permease [Arenibacterium sp.]
MTAQDRPSLGINLRILSGVQMVGMFICVKAVSDDVPLGEIVFFRPFFAPILAGLAVSFLFAAITTYLIFAGDSRAAHTVIFWMLGGLGLARWETFPLVCSGLLLILSYTLLRNRWLDALLTGDLTAATLGVPVKRLRFSMFFAAALATAVFVSVAGVIGFVGLMVPHIARGVAGPLHRPLIPTAALVGACLLTGSDILSRLLLAPQELPVGIVTTSIGSVFVFLLLYRTIGWR